MAFEAMFQPIQIGKLTIRNRVLSTAHAEVYATDGGMTTDRYVKYYEEKAKGGIGLAICGGSSVVAIDSPQEWWSSVNLSTDRIIPHFQNLADAMHKHGAKIMIQITHMGRRSRWDGFNWPTLMSPSGVREPVHRATCKTIEPEEIWRVIGNYAAAAGRAKAGGLDGVELSAVHQHMIDQFWSPRVNKRTDEWGGSFENRMRFGLEVLKAVRKEVGPDFCVGIRLCGDEFHPDGLSHEDMKQIAKYYDDTGMLDFIGVVGSGCDTHNTLANVIPNMSYPPEPFLHLAAGIKEVVKVPVLHAQNIKDPNQATRILEGGYVDMVGMTRAHIADPHLIAKIKMGQIDQIKQCVGANYCIDRQYQGLDVLCIQNAATSREYMGLPHIIEKTSGPKRKVVIVGGGPAGMEAARVAAERGHDVTLFEKQDSLGGQISLAAKAPQRDQMAGQVAAVDGGHIGGQQHCQGLGVVPVQKMPVVPGQLVQRIQRCFQAGSQIGHADPARLCRAGAAQEVQADIGRRGAVRQHFKRQDLQVVGRQAMVLRRHTALKKAPGVLRHALQVGHSGGVRHVDAAAPLALAGQPHGQR